MKNHGKQRQYKLILLIMYDAWEALPRGALLPAETAEPNRRHALAAGRVDGGRRPAVRAAGPDRRGDAALPLQH